MAYYIYRDASNQWRWHLVAANGRKIANSGESYWNKQDCIHAVNLVKGSGLVPVLES